MQDINSSRWQRRPSGTPTHLSVCRAETEPYACLRAPARQNMLGGRAPLRAALHTSIALTPGYARRASSSPRCPSHLHRSYARICSESELLSSDVERLGATANVRRHYEVLRRQLRTQSRGCARELGPGTCGCAASTQEGRRALHRSSRSRPTMVVQQAHATKAKVHACFVCSGHMGMD